MNDINLLHGYYGKQKKWYRGYINHVEKLGYSVNFPQYLYPEWPDGLNMLPPRLIEKVIQDIDFRNRPVIIVSHSEGNALAVKISEIYPVDLIISFSGWLLADARERAGLKCKWLKCCKIAEPGCISPSIIRATYGIFEYQNIKIIAKTMDKKAQMILGGHFGINGWLSWLYARKTDKFIKENFS